MEKEIDKIKLVVYKEHTLGYIDPKLPNVVNILHSSPLKGSPRVTSDASFHINNESEIRLASEKDFDKFRVSFKGFDNIELYEFKQGEAKDIVGKISFYGGDGNIGEVVEYTDKESYLSALKKEMNYNISGFEYKTITSNPEIRKAVDDIVYGAHGVDNPHTIEWYQSSVNDKTKKRIEEIHVYSLKEGGYAINCKIDGVIQDPVKMSREDVNDLSDNTDRFKLVSKYFADRLSNNQLLKTGGKDQKAKLKAGKEVYLDKGEKKANINPEKLNHMKLIDYLKKLATKVFTLNSSKVMPSNNVQEAPQTIEIIKNPTENGKQETLSGNAETVSNIIKDIDNNPGEYLFDDDNMKSDRNLAELNRILIKYGNSKELERFGEPFRQTDAKTLVYLGIADKLNKLPYVMKTPLDVDNIKTPLYAVLGEIELHNLSQQKKGVKFGIGECRVDIRENYGLSDKQKNDIEIRIEELYKEINEIDKREAALNKSLNHFYESLKTKSQIPDLIKGVELTEEQKTKLAAGKGVFLKDMTSSKGKKFSNVVYLDKKEMKIKFRQPEKQSIKNENNKPKLKM